MTRISNQEEILTMLNEVIVELTSTQKNIKNILRKCQHICELLDWEPQLRWFHQELNGYYSDSVLPPLRKITGKKIWKPRKNASDGIMWDTEKMVYGVDLDVYDEEVDYLDVWAGIDFIISSTISGFHEPIGETKHAKSPSGRKAIQLERFRFFPANEFALILSEIERRCFDFCSKAYVQIQHGNLITDYWTYYRKKVDAGIENLQLTNHLINIENNLQSNNPESWRAVVLACRNQLNDLANILWQDNCQIYEHLPGEGRDNKLDVSQGKFANRLSAYLHQKLISGKQGKFIRDEFERLSISIRSLIGLQSKAHEPIEFDVAISIVIFTYILIGEIIIKTDLEPIKEYK